MTEAPDSELFVRAFARGLGVIEAMGRGPERQTLAQIAEAARLPRSVARRLLMTLCALDYAGTDGRLYWLTPRVMKLGLAYLYAQPLWRQAQRTLEDLRVEVQESCSMAVLDGTELVYVIRVPARRILSMNLSVGSRLPAHVVSLGRALLSGLPDTLLTRYLAEADLVRLTPHTETSPVKLRRAIEAVHGLGYAWVDAELDESICGIAVPVRDGAGQVVAAVNVSLTAGEWTERKARTRFLAPLRRAAAQIRSSMLT
ncbi:MAG TPA: IclR family transcriptional regulator C-terminal domain-containing protein [Quisquiliibacterium sp.]|nr:IclR family transcriptional regulator C-terminal domain-containing protein [Quisquiliibacterium sp.]